MADKNINNIEEAETKFKEISSAYDKISTTEKRQLYDNPFSPQTTNFNIDPFLNLINQMRRQNQQRVNNTQIIRTIRIINGVVIQETRIINI